MVSALNRSVISMCSSGTNRPTCLKTSCSASVHRQTGSVSSRRAVMKGLGVGLITVTTPKIAWSAAKPQSTNVGSYLPEADTGFVHFQPSDTQTPVTIIWNKLCIRGGGVLWSSCTNDCDLPVVSCLPHNIRRCVQAIRAGVIKANNAYRFVLPNSWSEQRIANIQSGNFCMVSSASAIASSASVAASENLPVTAQV